MQKKLMKELIFMRSLQILTPHMECIYNCPFCIAKAHKHENKFKDIYHLDINTWRDNLAKVLLENEDLKFVVITGTNEPMQSQDCVEDAIRLVRYYRPDIVIEIQTRWYNENPLYNELDTVCYSISRKGCSRSIRRGSRCPVSGRNRSSGRIPARRPSPRRCSCTWRGCRGCSGRRSSNRRCRTS